MSASDAAHAPLPDPATYSEPLTAADHAELLECARYGELENLVFLLRIGCDPDTADAAGSTAMHKAAANGFVPVLEALAERGARFVANASGNTPLHFACLTGQHEAAAWLLRRFARECDVFAKNCAGKSAFTECTSGGHEELARLLLQHGSAEPGRVGGGGGGGSGAGAAAADGAGEADEDAPFGEGGEAEDVGAEDEDLVDEVVADKEGGVGDAEALPAAHRQSE